MKHKTSISHDEMIVRELRADPDFAAEYLKAAVEDVAEPKVLLIALRHLAETRGGIAKVAKAAGIQSESLYRALSPRGAIADGQAAIRATTEQKRDPPTQGKFWKHTKAD